MQTPSKQLATTLVVTLAVPLILGASAPPANKDLRRYSRQAKKPNN
jgi:hypothetical protein